MTIKIMCSASWKHFQATLYIGTATMGLPFSWSRKKSKVIPSWKGKSRMLAVVVTLLFYVTYLAYFVVFDFKRQKTDNNRTKDGLTITSDILVRYVYMMGGLLAAILYGNLWYFLESYLSYINEWLQLHRYIEGTYIRSDKRPWRLDCDQLVQVLSAAYVVIPSIQVFHFIEFPESKMYGYWALKGTIVDEIIYFSHIIVIFGGIFTCICAALFHAHIYLIPISICFQTLRECRPGSLPFERFPVTCSNLRQTKNALRVYRSFYLNFHLGNQCINNILYCFQSVATSAFVGCNCFLVRLGGDLNPRIAFILFTFSFFGTFLWLVLLQAAGLTHKKTSSWIKMWKLQWSVRRERSYNRKTAAALRPVSVTFSGLYKITLLRVITYLHLVMRGTIKGVLVLLVKY